MAVSPYKAKPVMEMSDDDFGMTAEPDDFIATEEGYEILVEDELQRDYHLTTLFKANADNFNEFSQRYNLICQELEKSGDIDAIAELVDVRFKARCAALDGVSVVLEASPYSDMGAAILYGYVEGAREMAKSMYSAASDETKVMPISAIDLVNGKV